MQNSLKVLIEGYAKENENGWLASCSTTLIRTSNHTIIVDPGINKNLLLEKLAEENLRTKDIDYVFLTHHHPDHMLLAGLFTHTTIFDGETIYKDDKEVEYEGSLPDTDIKVIATPGHANEHASLVVKTEDLGTVVIAADVFWWTVGEEQKTDKETLLNREDSIATDMEALKQSRATILKIADWVIPGHGKMFKVEKQ